MFLCHICDKPFTKESSYKRHISYCRRNQTRPRTRPTSCRSCNAAKVKCTFQAPCRRCTAKGLYCIYELRSRSIATVEDGEAAPSNANDQTVIDFSGPTISQQGYNTSNVDISSEENLQSTDTFDLLNNTGNMEEEFMELLPLNMDESITYEYDGTHDINTTATVPPANKDVSFETSIWPHSFIQPRMSHAAQVPWSAWTTRVANPPTVWTPNLNEIFSLSQRECLALLKPANPVVQHNTHLVVQALRAYPLMMLRRETLPPFIHPHWHCQSTPALPEPLSNCMSIAQMYAFRSEETKPFLWRTIKAEDERFLAQRTILSPQDLLAALQAQMIYMIMRFVDGSSEPVNLNQQLVITYQFLCKQFRKVSGSIFCGVDQFFPRPSWEDWIFDESRRRTTCLFFIICRCVSVDTGIPECDVFKGFAELPLASPKTLWEAKTRADWELEYSAYSTNQDTGIHTMGTLVKAHKRNNDPAKARLLDYWNGRADNLGNLLNITASMV